MCLYQTDSRRRRQTAVDERPRDVVASELDGLVEARRPALRAQRPILRRVLGVTCAAYGRARRLAGQLRVGPSAAGELCPGAQ